MLRPLTREKYPPAGRRTPTEHRQEYERLMEQVREHQRKIGRTTPIWPDWLRWFERTNPFQFWQTQVAGGGPSTVKHFSRPRAEREAVRLAIKLGQPVYVTHTVACAIPCRPPAPAVELVDAVTGSVEFFNHPQEVDHMTSRERKDQHKLFQSAIHKPG